MARSAPYAASQNPLLCRRHARGSRRCRRLPWPTDLPSRPDQPIPGVNTVAVNALIARLEALKIRREAIEQEEQATLAALRQELKIPGTALPTQPPIYPFQPSPVYPNPLIERYQAAADAEAKATSPWCKAPEPDLSLQNPLAGLQVEEGSTRHFAHRLPSITNPALNAFISRVSSWGTGLA
jgi:hypothetical protein